MALAQNVGAALLHDAEASPLYGIIERIIETLRKELADDVWALFHKHADDVLLTKKVLFVTIKLRVRDARFLVELIAGPEPEAVA